ncbi:MAG: two-component regulator propeller domain-containing protein [Saprospiraceae bacterium]
MSKDKKFTAVSYLDTTNWRFQTICQIPEYWNQQHPTINFLVTSKGEIILYDEEQGLRVFDKKTQQPVYLNNFFTDNHPLPSSMPILLEDQRGRVWMSFHNYPGLYIYQNGNIQLFSGVPPLLTYTHIWEDDMGNLIVNQAINGGLYPASRQLFCITPQQQVVNFNHLLNMGEYLLKFKSRNFFRTLFCGTDTGLKVAQNTTTKVEHYLASQIGEDRRGFSMRGICADTLGNLYFAREIYAWYKLDAATQSIDTIRLHTRYGQYLDFNNCLGIWSGQEGYIYGVSGDGSDRRYGYVHQYDPVNCTNNSWGYPATFTAYGPLDNGSCWLGGKLDDNSNRLLFFDANQQTFTDYKLPAPLQETLYPFTIRYILPEAGGKQLWLGTENGLFYLDIEQQTFRHYTAKLPTNSFSSQVPLSDNNVYSLYKGTDGKLWIGTQNGLNQYDTNNHTWQQHNTQDGLPSPTVASIQAGDKGALWISTYNGLYYFTPEGEQSRSFFQIDGISHNEFNRFSSFRAKDGRYYFGGVNGINAFFPEDLLVSKDIPKVQLANFSFQDKNTDTLTNIATYWPENQEIVIKPNYTYFSFDFMLPVYTPTVYNQFRYRSSDDPEKGWIYLKSDRSLRFSNMKAGKYQLLVEGADANGNWGNEPLVIRLWVKEVFYKQWWFIALSFLFLAALIYGVIRYRTQQELRLERLRTQLASDLHDEVSGLLAGISLQSELLRDQVNDAIFDTKLLNIRQASQKAMSKMSDVIWSIDSRRDHIHDLIARMEEHADEVLLPIGIRYSIQTANIDRDQRFNADIRQNLYFICKEAINNVAKHSQADKVEIRIEHTPQGLFELTIYDNGAGMDAEKLVSSRRGQGLANIKMRAQRIQAELSFIASPGFTLHLRMKKFIK